MTLIIDGMTVPMEYVTDNKVSIKDVVATEKQSESGKDFVEYARRGKVSMQIDFKLAPASVLREMISITDKIQVGVEYDLYGIKKNGYFRRDGEVSPSLVMQTDNGGVYNFSIKLEEY